MSRFLAPVVLAWAFAFGLALPSDFLKSLKSDVIKQMTIVEDAVFQAEAKSKQFVHPLLQYMRANLKSSPPRVGTFKWSDCGSGSDLLHINGLDVSPDPLKLPGNVQFKFDVDIMETVDAPLKLVLKVEKKEGPIWITIPCIGGVGSCTWDDLCDTLRGAVCPQPFVDNNIPCKCPFTKGHYSMPTSTINLDVGEIPNGEYYGKAELTYGQTAVTCIELYFSIS